MEKLHNGYFAQDKKGVLKDTRGDTQADDEVYNLIMRDKERLLALDEPLRFIFSHSALREGWDSPNVFQICTLNETKSTIKKRQEIRRGLRLPVDQNGLRVFDDSINKLYVMANESYEDFARALQTEYEEDCGVTFGKVPLTALAKLLRIVDDKEAPIGREAAEAIRAALVSQKMLDDEGRIQPAFDPKRKDFRIELPDPHGDMTDAVIDLLAAYQIERHIQREADRRMNPLKKEVQLGPEFVALWERIKPRTTYRVEFETDALVDRAVAEVKRMEKVEKPRVRVSAGQVAVGKGGVTATPVNIAEEKIEFNRAPVPDVLAYLQNETELTRSTLVRILKESGRLGELFNNPQRFLDAVAGILRHEHATRNRLLAEAFEKLRLVERAGIGRSRMFIPILSYGKRAPRYETDGSRVTLRIYNGSYDQRMATLVAEWRGEEREIDLDALLILAHLRENAFIDTTSAAELLQAPRDDVRTILDALALPGTGILDRSGHTRAATYHLTKSMAKDLLGKAAYTKTRGLDPIRYAKMVRASVDDHGSITPRECRQLLGLGESQSARVEISKLLNRWSRATGFLRREGKSPKVRYFPR